MTRGSVRNMCAPKACVPAGKRLLTWLAVAVLAAVLLSGCGAPEATDASGRGGELSGTESDGERMDGADDHASPSSQLPDLSDLPDLPDQPRVAALMGSFAEIWMLAGGELAGVTDDAFTEKQLEISADVAVLGSFNLPNLEAIIALEPDLVLLSSETEAHETLRKPLSSVGIETMYFNVTYFQDYLEMLKVCTELTGRKDLYKENGEAVKAQIDDVVRETQKAMTDQPRILLLITYSGGMVVKGSDCMAGEMLKDLGCVNIADEEPSLLKEMSLEAVIQHDPDYVFVIPMGNSDELALKNLRETIESNPAWEGLTAVKEERYILLPKERFLYKPNQLWGESYGYLAEILVSGQN